MRTSLRIIILLVCLIHLGTVVSAAVPAYEPVCEPSALASDAEASASVWTEPEYAEPQSTEAEEPEPAEPEPVEPEPVEPEPVEPEPVEPEPEEPEPEIPVSAMTDAQIIEKYSIKNNWARDGLIFAVRNGILAGKGGDNLCPKDNTTHAELATMLMGILRTEKRASMDRFTDVRAKDWFAEPMSKAVSLGIFPIADPNATTLTPRTNITREAAYVAIARVFGVHGEGRQSIYQFSDWKEVSGWAAEDLSAMIDAGCLAGSNGKIMPKSQITRQELAVILSNLLTSVGTSLNGSLVTGNPALAADTIPAGTTVNGNLLLSTDTASVTLENVTVTGQLIVQGNDTLTLRLTNCSIGELVLCRPTDLYADKAVSNITAHSFLKLYCDAKTVNVYDHFILYGEHSVDKLYAMYDAAMTIVGTVKDLYIIGDSVYINGKGTIQTLHQYGIWLANHCETENVVGTVRRTPEDATASRTDGSIPSPSSAKATMKLKLANMPDGWTECDLVWYLNGKQVARTNRNLCKQGSVISQACDFSAYMDGSHKTVKLTVRLISGGFQKEIFSGDVKLDVSLAALAKQIRTQDVQGTLTVNTPIYANMTLSGPIKTYPAGTQVTLLQSRHSSYSKVRTADGTEGWVSYYAVRVISGQYYTTTDYSTAVKEYYVNYMRNCTSSTGYLIWVSLYTQRVNVFKGSKGNWKLVKSGPIASGRNECPTPVEVTKIQYKTAQWTYSAYYCHHVSVFDEARGFHSRPTAYSGGIYSSAIGYPASNGCVRLLDEDCTYIYDNCPVGTAVYIY